MQSKSELSIPAWLVQSGILIELNRCEEALNYLNMLILIQDNIAEAWYLQGWGMLKLGRYADAIISCDRALQIKPNEPNAFYYKACCYAVQGDVSAAIANLKQAITFNPECREMSKTESSFNPIRENEIFKHLIDNNS